MKSFKKTCLRVWFMLFCMRYTRICTMHRALQWLVKMLRRLFIAMNKCENKNVMLNGPMSSRFPRPKVIKQNIESVPRKVLSIKKDIESIHAVSTYHIFLFPLFFSLEFFLAILNRTCWNFDGYLLLLESLHFCSVSDFENLIIFFTLFTVCRYIRMSGNFSSHKDIALQSE